MSIPSLKIEIDYQPTSERLGQLDVFQWPIWTKEASEFPWTYDESETCYFLDGEVTVTPIGGQPVQMGAGNLVIFPAGMSCTWLIRKAVKKHYRFG